jgi:hypothetical protein
MKQKLKELKVMLSKKPLYYKVMVYSLVFLLGVVIPLTEFTIMLGLSIWLVFNIHLILPIKSLIIILIFIYFNRSILKITKLTLEHYLKKTMLSTI